MSERPSVHEQFDAHPEMAELLKMAAEWANLVDKGSPQAGREQLEAMKNKAKELTGSEDEAETGLWVARAIAVVAGAHEDASFATPRDIIGGKND